MHIPEVDRWVSAEFQRLAELVQDYDPDLELRWIPPEFRQTMEDKKRCYCIFDKKRNVEVLFASELDSPTDILAKLFEIDNKNANVLDKIRAHNQAVAAMKMKEYLDELESRSDFVQFVLKNTKSTWRHDGVKYDDEFRRMDGHKRHIT